MLRYDFDLTILRSPIRPAACPRTGSSQSHALQYDALWRDETFVGNLPEFSDKHIHVDLGGKLDFDVLKIPSWMVIHQLSSKCHIQSMMSGVLQVSGYWHLLDNQHFICVKLQCMKGFVNETSFWPSLGFTFWSCLKFWGFVPVMQLVQNCICNDCKQKNTTQFRNKIRVLQPSWECNATTPGKFCAKLSELLITGSHRNLWNHGACVLGSCYLVEYLTNSRLRPCDILEIWSFEGAHSELVTKSH